MTFFWAGARGAKFRRTKAWMSTSWIGGELNATVSLLPKAKHVTSLKAEALSARRKKFGVLQ